jgi:hypothetical protein
MELTSPKGAKRAKKGAADAPFQIAWLFEIHPLIGSRHRFVTLGERSSIMYNLDEE